MQRVLVLEDDDDLRSLLCDLLVGSGAKACVSAGSFEAMVGQKAQVLECGLALLDVNLGGGVPSGLDAYHWLCPWLLGTATFAFGAWTGIGAWESLVWGFVISTVLLWHGCAVARPRPTPRWSGPRWTSRASLAWGGAAWNA